MNNPSTLTRKPADPKIVSNITVDKDGGVQLNLNNPDTTKKLLDIIDAFRKARPVPTPRK